MRPASGWGRPAPAAPAARRWARWDRPGAPAGRRRGWPAVAATGTTQRVSCDLLSWFVGAGSGVRLRRAGADLVVGAAPRRREFAQDLPADRQGGVDVGGVQPGVVAGQVAVGDRAQPQ